MVRLSRIYTRSGDDGSTGLGDGSRVGKDSLRVEAYGTVDEANATLGLVRLHLTDGSDEAAMLDRIRNDLFDLGADLCTPQAADEQPGKALRISATQVTRLEAEIDVLNETLEPLNSFVLPGGSAAAAYLHLARTVTRRAERLMVHLAREEAVTPEAIRYANRLSDHLFVLARHLNDRGRTDVLWSPGATR